MIMVKNVYDIYADDDRETLQTRYFTIYLRCRTCISVAYGSRRFANERAQRITVSYVFHYLNPCLFL